MIEYFVGNRSVSDPEGMPIIDEDGTEYYIDPETEFDSLGRPGADAMSWVPQPTTQAEQGEQ